MTLDERAQIILDKLYDFEMNNGKEFLPWIAAQLREVEREAFTHGREERWFLKETEKQKFDEGFYAAQELVENCHMKDAGDLLPDTAAEAMKQIILGVLKAHADHNSLISTAIYEKGFHAARDKAANIAESYVQLPVLNAEFVKYRNVCMEAIAERIRGMEP